MFNGCDPLSGRCRLTADFHVTRYILLSEFPKESYATEEEADEIRTVYKLDGGGELIELSTSNSNIEIHKLHR